MIFLNKNEVKMKIKFKNRVGSQEYWSSLFNQGNIISENIKNIINNFIQKDMNEKYGNF
jgi:hypothetical protein